MRPGSGNGLVLAKWSSPDAVDESLRNARRWEARARTAEAAFAEKTVELDAQVLKSELQREPLTWVSIRQSFLMRRAVLAHPRPHPHPRHHPRPPSPSPSLSRAKMDKAKATAAVLARITANAQEMREALARRGDRVEEDKYVKT